MKKDTYLVSELASEFEVSPRTIRYYENRGLLSPARSRGNYRIFSRRDRARLRLILRGKRFGYSLEEIREMIGLADTDMTEIEQIEKSLDFGERKLVEIRHRMAELGHLKADLLAVKAILMDRLAQLKQDDDDDTR